MFAVDKNGTGSMDKVNVISCFAPHNLLQIGNVTFVVGSEFNVSCFNCLLSNCVSTLYESQPVMVVH